MLLFSELLPSEKNLKRLIKEIYVEKEKTIQQQLSTRFLLFSKTNRHTGIGKHLMTLIQGEQIHSVTTIIKSGVIIMAINIVLVTSEAGCFIF